MRPYIPFLLLATAGCSTAPVADILDATSHPVRSGEDREPAPVMTPPTAGPSLPVNPNVIPPMPVDSEDDRPRMPPPPVS